jgi:hypothetical protein
MTEERWSSKQLLVRCLDWQWETVNSDSRARHTSWMRRTGSSARSTSRTKQGCFPARNGSFRIRWMEKLLGSPNPLYVPSSKLNQENRLSLRARRMWSSGLASWVVVGFSRSLLMDRSTSTCSKCPTRWSITHIPFPPTQIIVKIYYTERKMTCQEVKIRRKDWKYCKEEIENSGTSITPTNTDVNAHILPYY